MTQLFLPPDVKFTQLKLFNYFSCLNKPLAAAAAPAGCGCGSGKPQPPARPHQREAALWHARRRTL